MEVPSLLPGILNMGLRAILIWLWDVLSHDQIWVHGHSNVIEGCVPTLLDIRIDAILWENGGTCSVTRNTQFGTEGHSDMTIGCSLTWSDVSTWPFWCDWGMCFHLIWYKGCCHSLNGGTWSVSRKAQSGTERHSDMTVGCVLTWSDMSDGPFWRVKVRCKGWAILTSQGQM